MNKQQRDKKLREDERKLTDAFGAIMQLDSGRRVINWLIEQSHIYHACATPEMEGERRLGLKMLVQLNEHPDLYMKMLNANYKEAQFEKEVQQVEKHKEKENEDDV